eukprot:g5313.t1
MKLLFCVFALAAATAPPRIELDLAGRPSADRVVAATQTTCSDCTSDAPCLSSAGCGKRVDENGQDVATGGICAADETDCEASDEGEASSTSKPNDTYKLVTRAGTPQAHPDGLYQPDGVTPVMSRQDWTQTCAASTTLTEKGCPFPEAHAYDHNDKDINVREQIWLLDADGVTENDAKVTRSQIKLSLPAVYLFKFDATDEAGNHAEQVVFTMILNDITAPAIELCGCPTQVYDTALRPSMPKTCFFDSKTGTQVLKVEANSTWSMCWANARDNCGSDGCIDNPDSWATLKDGALGKSKYCVKKCVTSSGAKQSWADCKQQVCSASDFKAEKSASIAAALSTKKVGRYMVKIGVEDGAAGFGADGSSNRAEAIMDVTISDDIKPVITPLGDTPLELIECDWNATYLDQSNGVGNPPVMIVDNLDTEASLLKRLQSDLSKVKMDSPDEYWVTYDVDDEAGNSADGCTGDLTCGAQRKVKVQDTENPNVVFADGRYQINYAVGSITDIDEIDSGVIATDKCDKSVDKMPVSRTITPFWHPNKAGTYVATYKVCDVNTRCTNVTRSFVGTDKTEPVITVLGKQTVHIDAKRDGAPYEDAGATCRDYVDGVYSAKVAEKGDDVDPSTPGTYTVIYTCSDVAGNNATEMNRTVIVTDNDAPSIKLKGKPVMHIEAGAPGGYVEPGWETTDEIDDDATISQACTHPDQKGCTLVVGDTMNTLESFVSRRSCAEIKAFQKEATESGYYYITTFQKTTKSFMRVKVWCDMGSLRETDNTAPGFTYYKCEKCNATVPYGTAQGDCAAFGMKMAEFDTPSGYSTFRNTEQWTGAKREIDDDRFFPNAGISTTNYLCSVNDHNDPQEESDQSDMKDGVYRGTLSASIAHDEISANEQGKYTIKYMAKDMAGNPSKTLERVVIVKDTFKPVITLHLNDKLIQVSKVDSDKNQAIDPAHNQWLRDDISALTEGLAAEVQVRATNAWFVAGALSAVAGVALLAASSRRSGAAAVTTVPV